jgi:hypothetical protein
MTRITDCSSCGKDVAVCTCRRSMARMVTRKKTGGFCHKCQLKRGGVAPKGMGCVTATLGICSECGEDTSLIPSCDYNWPKLGKKAIWD